MGPRYESGIGVDFRPAGGNEKKAVEEKSKWNGKVDEMRDLVTWLFPLLGHYKKFGVWQYHSPEISQSYHFVLTYFLISIYLIY